MRPSPHKPAIIYRNNVFSYDDLTALISSLSEDLDRDFKSSDIVALWLPNSPALICLMLACMKSGIIPIPIHYGMKWPEVDAILKHTKVTHLITSEKLIKSRGEDPPSSNLPCIYTIDPDLADKKDSRYKIAINNQYPGTIDPFKPDKLALILLTSGSNGSPKAVMLSHDNLTHILNYRLQHTGLNPDSTSIVASCLSQSMGLYQTLALLAAGATLTLLESYDTDQIVSLMGACRPSHLIMSVDAFDKLLHHKNIESEYFSNIAFAAAGADRVIPQLQKRFIELTGKPLCISYGLTESSWALINSGFDIDKCLAMGKPCPDIEIRLLDGNGGEVLVGEIGEIRIRSPRTMLGYLNDEALTSTAIINGWLTTGDLAYQDSDGYYWFAGRSKNLIVLRSGDNVAPAEIENVILGHPAITNCVVIGHHLSDTSEVPWALVVRRDNTLSKETLLEYLHSQLTNYKIPYNITFVSELPIGLTGKIHTASAKKLIISSHPETHKSI